MKTRQTAVLTLLLALFVLAGCEHRDADAGRVTTERRDVKDFNSINMQGTARLEVTVGAPQSLTLEASESAIDRIRTEVRDGALYIRSEPRHWFVENARQRITLRVSAPKLESLQLEGGNDVRLNGFDGGKLSIRAEGAANIRARGRLDELKVHMAGAGHADLAELVANDAEVVVDGVGSVYVHPKVSLDATMNGVGAIFYGGNPQRVNTRMNGVGTIRQRKEGDRARSNPQEIQPESAESKRASDSTEVI